MMLLDKIAIIYGAGGAAGSTVAETFAREGAKLFLTGRNKAATGNGRSCYVHGW